jgi:asparagine synthase (glutamine-hydrolysing)
MPRERAERELCRMVEALRHEDFYVSGTWIDDSMGVYVGWVAQKGSFSDGMPLRNEDGTVVLTFAGEEYPDRSASRELKERGHEFEADGSTYLVHKYEEDRSFPAGLNGRFHGLVADRNLSIAVLFNDRYGMHRLYYHQSDEAFYFAAEAKAILGVRPELKRVSRQSLGEFVACGAVLEDRTLFDGICLLPPGSAWVFRNGILETSKSYFDPRDWENQEILQPETYYRNLREVFSRNLDRYFDGKQPIAMSLTGGLDTRMVMAWRKPAAGSLPCYTFGGMYRDCQDVLRGREVAEMCGQTHQVIKVGDEFLSQFSHYAQRTVFLTDGAVDVGHCPDLYVSERVRKIAPVRMTGNYGGEVLRRIRSFKPVDPLPGLFKPDVLSSVQDAKLTYSKIVRGNPVSFAVFRQAPWHHYGTLGLEQTQISLRSPFLDNDFVRTVFQSPAPFLESNDVSLRLISDGNRNLLTIPTDRGVGGSKGKSLEAASRALLEFQFKAEYAYDAGMPQWLATADHAVSSLHLERLFLGRHKTFHFRVWYRDSLGKYIQEMLLDSRSLSRPYIERRTLEEIVRGHVKGNRNYTEQIHKVLTLELTHRLFVDSN